MPHVLGAEATLNKGSARIFTSLLTVTQVSLYFQAIQVSKMVPLFGSHPVPKSPQDSRIAAYLTPYRWGGGCLPHVHPDLPELVGPVLPWTVPGGWTCYLLVYRLSSHPGSLAGCGPWTLPVVGRLSHGGAIYWCETTPEEPSGTLLQEGSCHQGSGEV